MATERLNAGIVEIILDDMVSVWLDRPCTMALGVAGIHDCSSIRAANTSSQDLHIVAVNVHGMRIGKTDADHDYSDGAIRAYIVDCTLDELLVSITRLRFEPVSKSDPQRHIEASKQ